MGFCYRWSSPGIHTWPMLFLLYVNDIISDVSNPVLYPDDASLRITNSNSQMFEKNINTAILQIKQMIY